MSSLQSQLLAAVERSPAAAAAYDRAGWVGLFTRKGRIEDPVGSLPHTGVNQVGRFFDTFIAPRRIVFHRDLDVVSGNSVIRDLTLEVGMGTSVIMRIPAVLRYDLCEEDGQWRIDRLRAYWELPAMMMRFLGSGLAAIPQAVALTRSLLGNQGLRGSAGFAAGFRGARVRGKRTAQAFLEAISTGDLTNAAQFLTQQATITHGGPPGGADSVGTAVLATLGDAFADAIWPKIIAAGSTVAVSIRSAADPNDANGVLFVETTRDGARILAVTYFSPHEA